MAPASIGCAVSELCKKFNNEVNVELSTASQDTTHAVFWWPTITLFSRFETSWKHSRNVPEVLFDKAVVNSPAHKRMTGKYILDVFW